ncbi:MAG: hypothetical protein AAF693_13725, partial [Bacteroidota bacterium]
MTVSPLSVPGAPVANSGGNCGPGTVNLSGTPGANGNTLRWYTSPTGGVHFRQSTTYAPSLSSTTTYYISTYNSTVGCEGDTRVPITATIHTIPSTPSTTDGTHCGPGVVNLAASPGVNGNTIRWYTASSGGSPIHQNTIYSPNLSTTTTYYVTSYNTTTGCEGSPRVAITGTIYDPPADPNPITTCERFGVGE